MIKGIIIYGIMAILVFTFLYVSKKCTGVKKYILEWMAVFIIFIIAAIRVNVGNDYISYVKWFDNINGIKKINDIGFNVLILFIKIFTNNSQWIFVISSLIINVFIFLTMKEEQEYYDISMLLFITLSFFFSSNNTIRQWIAISFILFSFRYIKQKKKYKFIVTILLASSFHILAILCTPLYFLLNFNLEKKKRIIFTISCLLIIIVIFQPFILKYILKYLLPFYYNRYLLDGESLFNKSGGSIFPVLLTSLIFIYYNLCDKKLIKLLGERNYNYKSNISSIVFIMSVVNTFNSLTARFATFFLPAIIILIPDFVVLFKVIPDYILSFINKNRTINKIFKLLENKSEIIMYIILICGSMIFMQYSLICKDSYNALPYNTIISQYWKG